MRGVSLRGRRPPANRSAVPARPPVVPAAVPRRSRRGHAVSGFAAAHGPCPEGRTRGTAARRSTTTRHSAAHKSAARGTRFANGPPSPVAPGIRTGTTTTARHRPAAGDLHRQPMPPPDSGVCAVPRWPKGQPALLLPTPRRLAAAGPAAASACRAHHLPTAEGLVVPHKPALRVPAGPCPGAASNPVRPLSATASAGPWPLLSRTRSGAGLAGQRLAGTGYGPDLCPLPATGRNQLPGMSYVPNRLLRSNTSLP